MSDEPSYEERLQTALNPDNEEDPDEVVPDKVKYYGMIYGLIYIGTGIGFYFVAGPIVAFALVMCLAVIPLFATATGRAFRKELARDLPEKAEENQQVASGSRSQKRLCQACGWQNPPKNAYCHDCGTELGQSE